MKMLKIILQTVLLLIKYFFFKKKITDIIL